MSKHITEAEVAFCRTDLTMGDRRQLADEVAMLRRALRKVRSRVNCSSYHFAETRDQLLLIIDRALGRKGKS